MRLLYSNILPVGIEEGQATIAETFVEQIADSDSVEIAVGYVSKASLEELDALVEAHHIQHISLVIGMYYIEGMPEGTYRTALAINEKWRVSGVGEIRMTRAFKYHGKLLPGTFVISPWLLIVPVLTGVMISRRWPSMVVLFLAIFLAVIVALLVQSHLIQQISGEAGQGLLTHYKGMMQVCYGSTDIETGIPMLNELVHTSGMSGMMPTIWLIICAQTFGGALTATGQLQDLMRVVLRFARGTASLVASTVGTSLFCNIAMADQYLSIMLASSMFKDTYRERGYESRLLSRSCEDSATVTSVLIPWNTCGLTQSTVLGVATLTYLPYCFFNYLSPLMSIFVASIGWKIKRQCS